MRRRSVSSLVSPGPRVPMPPPSRDSAVAGADQPRQQVLQLRQLDLQLAFARARAPREDVEDELRAIDDLAADRLFDVPQLRRRQLVVEDDDVDVGLGARGGERLDLAARRETSTDPASGRSCSTRSTTSAPAASARPASSSSDRSASSRRARPAISPTSAARSRPLLRRFGRLEPCAGSRSHRESRPRAPAPASAPVTSTIVDGGAAAASGRRRSAGRCDRRASRSTVIRIGGRRLAARVGARRRERPAAARQIARATSWAGTRTPTRPVPPVDVARQRRAAPRPAASAVPARTAPPARAAVADSAPELRGDLRRVGGDQRQRALGARGP